MLIQSSTANSADWKYKTNGYLYARLSSYTKNTSKNYGQEARAQLEQQTIFSKEISALNQIRLSSNSISEDLAIKSTPVKKDLFETYVGENYLKYKSENWIAQIGYQEVVWGESFGFNYADIINPKDQKETFYSDANDSRIPLLLINQKTFFTIGSLNGSMQVLYSPEPKFSKTLPIDMFTADIFPQTSIKINKQKSPDLFKDSEYGGKFSLTYSGYDFSIFNYNYIDRDPYYNITNTTQTDITLEEKHTKISSTGLSVAKSIYDFVIRSDLVLTNNKTINFLENSRLDSYTTDSLNTLISFDTPTYNDYAGVIIFANSSLKQVPLHSFKAQNEKYLIGKISKNLSDDKTVELSYTNELQNNGHSIQTSINWPISKSTDIKLGGQIYFGADQSNLAKYKNISSVFFSLKNYFQL